MGCFWRGFLVTLGLSRLQRYVLVPAASGFMCIRWPAVTDGFD